MLELEAGGNFYLSSELPYLSGRHELVDFSKGRELEFLWFVDGWKTKLNVLFELSGEMTKLSLNFTVNTRYAPACIEPLARADQYFYFIGQSWRQSLKQLRCVLESDSTGVVPNGLNNDHEINLSIEINSTAESIFKALTDAGVMRKWDGLSMENAEVETVVGGVYSYGWFDRDTPEDEIHDGPGKILELIQNKLLAVDWYGIEHMSTVSWEIISIEPGRSKLIFKHSGITGYSHAYVWSYRSGWSENLYSLKSYLEDGTIDSDWLSDKK